MLSVVTHEGNEYSAWFKVKRWRETNWGWLGSSWQSRRAPALASDAGGVDLRSQTPATRATRI